MYTTIETEQRGGNSPYGWSRDAYHVKIGGITVHTSPDRGQCVRFAEKLNKAIEFQVQKKDRFEEQVCPN